jgi:uncharacterized protein (TIGR02996 family)
MTLSGSESLVIQGDGLLPVCTSKSYYRPSIACYYQGTLSEQLDSIISGSLDQSTQGLAALTKTADGSEIDTLMSWIDLNRWRARGAKEFWVYLYFLVLRFGEARHIEAIRSAPDHGNDSDMDTWIANNRLRLGDWLEYRTRLDRSSSFDDKAMPKTRAKVMAYIQERIGNPDWEGSRSLVDLVKAQRFSLICEEGLHVCAALLLHGNAEDLKELRGLAVHQPILAQILQAHGVKLIDMSEGDALLQSVFLNPANDDARWVYSDWLMEIGDPQGEFIRAQLSGEEPIVKKKLRQHYAGDLREFIRWTLPNRDVGDVEPVFHRGFVHACVVNSLDGSGANTPGWEVIEMLDVLRTIENISDYRLTSLRFLGGLRDQELSAFMASPVAPQIEGLAFSRIRKAQRLNTWTLLQQLPSLRYLSLGPASCDPADEATLNHPLMNRVKLEYSESGGLWVDGSYALKCELLASEPLVQGNGVLQEA